MRYLTVDYDITEWLDIFNYHSQNHSIIFSQTTKITATEFFCLMRKAKNTFSKISKTKKMHFLRSMMWGSLWDSVRFYELDPKDYVELVIKNINVEKDEVTIASLLSRVSIAMTYYLSDEQAKELAPKLEKLLLDKMKTAKTVGQKITFYRAFLNIRFERTGKTISQRSFDRENPNSKMLI